MLLFKRRFLELIRTGRKVQTIRLWTYARVRPGQRAYVPGLGRVRIITVERLPSLAALTRADALADGFTTRRDMLAEIRRLYAGATGRAVYRVRFVWKSGRQPRRAQRAQPLETRNSTRETRKSRRRQLARFIQSLPPPPPRAAAPRP